MTVIQNEASGARPAVEEEMNPHHSAEDTRGTWQVLRGGGFAREHVPYHHETPGPTPAGLHTRVLVGVCTFRVMG